MSRALPADLDCIVAVEQVTDYLEGALPLAWDAKDPVLDLAVKCSRVVPALDREILRVRGLTCFRWSLSIEAFSVVTASCRRLATPTSGC